MSDGAGSERAELARGSADLRAADADRLLEVAEGPAPEGATGLDARALRSAFGRFATGVAVVSYEYEGEFHGVTVNSFTSVSMDPPLLLISLMRSSRSAARLVDRPFAVSILASDQLEAALRFARRGVGGPEPDWELAHGSPRLAGSLAHFSCRPWRAYDGGDHLLLLGEVLDFRADEEKRALVFYCGGWHGVGPADAPARVAG